LPNESKFTPYCIAGAATFAALIFAATTFAALTFAVNICGADICGGDFCDAMTLPSELLDHYF
jgi:hypothetical protein